MKELKPITLPESITYPQASSSRPKSTKPAKEGTKVTVTKSTKNPQPSSSRKRVVTDTAPEHGSKTKSRKVDEELKHTLSATRIQHILRDPRTASNIEKTCIPIQKETLESHAKDMTRRMSEALVAASDVCQGGKRTMITAADVCVGFRAIMENRIKLNTDPHIIERADNTRADNKKTRRILDVKPLLNHNVYKTIACGELECYNYLSTKKGGEASRLRAVPTKKGERHAGLLT